MRVGYSDMLKYAGMRILASFVDEVKKNSEELKKTLEEIAGTIKQIGSIAGMERSEERKIEDTQDNLEDSMKLLNTLSQSFVRMVGNPRG